MKTHGAELLQIKDLLRDNPKGMKITRIASKLGMNRNAAAKFLEILLMTGQVELLEHGMSKIFILSRRTGIPTMLDGSPDAILIVDQDMRIFRVNDNYLKFAGMQQEDLIAKRVDAQGLPIVGNPQVQERIRRARFGEDVRTEVKELSGGREHYYEIRMTPTAFNDGGRGITIVIGDITHEKMRQNSAMEESRKLVEGILSCIDDAVILLDSRAAGVSFINPAAEKMFGCGQEEFTGGIAGHLSGANSVVDGCSAFLTDAFLRQGYYETESRMKRNGMGEFSGHLHFRPVYNMRGELKNIVLIVREMDSNGAIAQADKERAPFSLPFLPDTSNPSARYNPAV